jgi:hypothetical protein
MGLLSYSFLLHVLCHLLLTLALILSDWFVLYSLENVTEPVQDLTYACSHFQNLPLSLSLYQTAKFLLCSFSFMTYDALEFHKLKCVTESVTASLYHFGSCMYGGTASPPFSLCLRPLSAGF